MLVRFINKPDLVKDGEKYYYIEGEGSKCFVGEVPPQLSDQTPNCLSAIFDDILWDDFKSRLDPLISQINKWFKLMFLFNAIGIIFVVTSLLLIEEIRIIIFVGVFCFSAPLFFMAINKNLNIDKEIKRILEDEYKNKVRSKGYSIEYRTKWTGLYKPKFTVPKRVIVFPKLENVDDVENSEEKHLPYLYEDIQQKESNNDGIDRKGWGL